MSLDAPSVPRAQFSAADLALLREYPNVPIVDGSSIDNWKKCRRQAWFVNQPPFGRGLRPMQAALPLEFGIIFHSSLDLVYCERPAQYEHAPTNFRKLFNARIAQIKRRKHDPLKAQMGQLEEARDLGIAMLEEWAHWAPPRDDFEVVATEAPMLVPIVNTTGEDVPGPRINRAVQIIYEPGEVIALYYMRLDGLVRDNRDWLWLREYKTTGRWWPGYYLDINSQVSRYCWGIKQRLGEAPHGVLMDFFLKQAVNDPPILKKTGLPTTSMAKLGYVTAERYAKAAGDFITFGPMREVYDTLLDRERESGHPTLRRVLVERTPYAIEEAGRRLSREVVKMLNSLGDLDITDDQFKCGMCPVQKLCRVMEDGDDAWEEMAEALYEVGTPMWEQDLEASK
jgi:hypothetical protein